MIGMHQKNCDFLKFSYYSTSWAKHVYIFYWNLSSIDSFYFLQHASYFLSSICSQHSLRLVYLPANIIKPVKMIVLTTSFPTVHWEGGQVLQDGRITLQVDGVALLIPNPPRCNSNNMQNPTI